MDVKRSLLTQVPSQTDDTTTLYDDSSRIGLGIEFDGYEEAIFDSSSNMTTLYIYSRPIGLRIEFDGYKEATFDPSSVSNGCWDQNRGP
eukprot:scaffold19470_cov27-Attheya_sp.AAC.1